MQMSARVWKRLDVGDIHGSDYKLNGPVECRAGVGIAHSDFPSCGNVHTCALFIESNTWRITKCAQYRITSHNCHRGGKHTSDYQTTLFVTQNHGLKPHRCWIWHCWGVWLDHTERSRLHLKSGSDSLQDNEDLMYHNAVQLYVEFKL